jgi:hypothetical protein
VSEKHKLDRVMFIGYTPDVFVALAAGWLLDRSPGVPGHQHFFLFLSAFAVIGLLASLLFRITLLRVSKT